MLIKFGRFKFVCIFLFVVLTLNGCAVAVVGAMSGAGVYAVDEKPSNHELNIVKTPDVQVPDVQVPDVSPPKKDIEKQQNPQVGLTQIPIILPLDTPQDQPVPAQAPFKLAQVQLKEDPHTTESSKTASHDVINNTSIDNLTGHAWKVIGQKDVKAFSFKSENSVFNFSKRGVFEAFISCNALSGKMQIDNAGKFFLSNLHSSNDLCADGRDQEVGIINQLLLANKFAIYDHTLILSVSDEPVLAFNATDKKIDPAIAYDAHKLKRHQKFKTFKHTKRH